MDLFKDGGLQDLNKKIVEVDQAEVPALRQRFATELTALAERCGVGLIGCVYGFHVKPSNEGGAYGVAMSHYSRGNTCEVQVGTEQLLQRIRRVHDLG